MAGEKPEMKEICLITSLAGTKDKGLWKLGPDRRTLVGWVLRTAKAYGCPIVVSTDQPEVARMAEAAGAMVSIPPVSYTSGNCHIEQAAYALEPYNLPADTIVHLMQPTSPFIRVSDLASATEALGLSKDHNSAQTVIPVPHNFHEWNQRQFDQGCVSFVHRWERATHYVKQDKPQRYAFGNLVSFRHGPFLDQGFFFAEPSIGQVIRPAYGLDVDDHEALEVAEVYLSSGVVSQRAILG